VLEHLVGNDKRSGLLETLGILACNLDEEIEDSFQIDVKGNVELDVQATDRVARDVRQLRVGELLVRHPYEQIVERSNLDRQQIDTLDDSDSLRRADDVTHREWFLGDEKQSADHVRETRLRGDSDRETHDTGGSENGREIHPEFEQHERSDESEAEIADRLRHEHRDLRGCPATENTAHDDHDDSQSEQAKQRVRDHAEQVEHDLR